MVSYVSPLQYTLKTQCDAYKFDFDWMIYYV